MFNKGAPHAKGRKPQAGKPKEEKREKDKQMQKEVKKGSTEELDVQTKTEPVGAPKNYNTK